MLLLKAHSGKAVTLRYFETVRSLTAEGVTFPYGAISPLAEKSVQMIRAHVPGMSQWAREAETGLMYAVDADGALIGCIAVSAARFDTSIQAAIRAVVVDQSWRGHGVGTALLGMVEQLVKQSADLVPNAVIGTCPEAEAPFYQRSGFTVLAPGFPLPSEVAGAGHKGLLVNTGRETPCWFYREAWPDQRWLQ
ncbi:GNAT family N-acetyltransferase [Dietzia cercidiphylli]|uniref:GNAT family N-acetyltransferase n=1 Tax=Dietzia cercidiphylli TaxID=498199 RepID=UPI00223C423E|nr:GNAT family N-acetyltransferase [Dietzia cercidiphylli]MCT1515299.1 GNAT family N-acetyltransferase [Dietzia cercidiphylli]